MAEIKSGYRLTSKGYELTTISRCFGIYLTLNYRKTGKKVNIWSCAGLFISVYFWIVISIQIQYMILWNIFLVKLFGWIKFISYFYLQFTNDIYSDLYTIYRALNVSLVISKPRQISAAILKNNYYHFAQKISTKVLFHNTIKVGKTINYFTKTLTSKF